MNTADEIAALRTTVHRLQAIVDRQNDRGEEVLRLAHNAPMAVKMDTRDVLTAMRRLVDFAWEQV